MLFIPLDITNDNLYDFLLSLVNCEYIQYDYNGDIVYSDIVHYSPLKEKVFSCNINFNEKDCKNGIYTFSYKIRN